MNLESLFHDLCIVLIIALASAGVSFFLDFCLGQPGNDEGPKTKEIFFGWTLQLAWWRLKRSAPRLLRQINEENLSLSQLTTCPDPITSAANKKNRETAIVENAKRFFTWEWAFGMCIYCTNVWITAIGCTAIVIWTAPELLVLPVYILPLPTIIFAHLILRKLF